MNQEFWSYLQRLVDSNEMVLDRPRGSLHPRFIHRQYPVDYGFLSGTTAIDGGGVDIWVGSLGQKKVTGALCTVDLLKKDTELKIVYDCSDDEIEQILDFVNDGEMRAIYIKRDEYFGG